VYYIVLHQYIISIFSFFIRNEALRIAYIDVFEIIKNGNPSTEYYSKLVKAGIHGKDKVSGNWFWTPFLLSNTVLLLSTI
jgi:hypothetical protein